MKEMVRIGIIGCGNIAQTKHMTTLEKLEGVELLGFYDLDNGRAQHCCTRFGAGGAKVYPSAEQLLKSIDIDAVHICTPNSSHAYLSILALRYGKHVMVEKPMSISTAEAKQMMNAAEMSGKTLTISHQMRFRKDVLWLKDKVKSGELGEIYFAKARAVRRRGVPSWGSFLNKELQGGGALIDIGCHALDMSLWLMDNFRPKVVVGNTYNIIRNKQTFINTNDYLHSADSCVEESAFGFITMENGATLTIETSWALNTLDSDNVSSTLYGTRGGADMNNGTRINYDQNNSLKIIGFTDNQNNLELTQTPEYLEASQWIESIRSTIPPLVLPEQVFAVVQIIEALYLSAASGRAVYL